MHFSNKSVVLFAALVAFFFVLCRQVFASIIYVPNTYGLTARGIALANALTGDNEDLSGAYYNAAGLTGVEESEFGLGYIYSMPFLHGGLQDGSRVRENTNNKIVSIALRLNVRRFFSENINMPAIGFGLNVTADDNFSTMMVFDDMRTHNGAFDRYGLSNMSMQAAFGIGITDWMSLGLGFHGGFLGRGIVETKADVDGSTANEGTRMRGSLRPRPLGSLFFHGDSWGIGLNYRDETFGSFEPIDVEAEPSLSGLEIPTLDIPMNFFDTFVPREASLGFSWDATEDLTVLGDLSWRNWDRYGKAAAKSHYVGSMASFETIDIWTPRLGLEYAASDQMTLRSGYRYEQTPFRTIGTRFPQGGEEVHGKVILDNDVHVASLGGGYAFDSKRILAIVMTLDMVYQLHYHVFRQAKTSDGYLFESEGAVHLVSGMVTFSFR